MLQAILRGVEKATLRFQGKGWGSASTGAEVRAALSKVPTPRIVVDVGGNVGNWSAEMLKRAAPDRLFIFEPAASNIGKLEQRFAGRDNVTILPFALSDHDGRSAFYTDSDGSGLASLHRRTLDHIGLEHKPAGSVETMSWTTFRSRHASERIDVLKLDIEGHEYSVLSAIPAHDLERIGVIQFEFGGCNIDSRTYLRDFWYLLSGRFAFYRMTPLGLAPVRRYRETEEVFTTTNFLCVNRDIGG